MQRSNSILLLAVVVGLLIMTVWRLLGDEIPRPPDSGGGDPVGIEVAPRDPQPELAADAPRVAVAVTLRERYVSPLPVRVQAVELPRRNPLPTTLLAGTGADPFSRPDDALRAGAVLAAIEIDGGRLVRQVGVEAAQLTELEVGSPLTVTGTVRDTQGAPVLGARIWLGELDAEGNPREVLSDDTGAFEAAVRGGAGVPLVVRADGLASTWRSIRVGVDVVREHAITLVAAGVLQVQVVGQAEHIEAGEVFWRTSGARSSELSRSPFFLQAVFGGVGLDSAGSATIVGLPQQGALEVIVVHPLVVLGGHEEVRLAGARTSCVVPLRFGSSWAGSVVGSEGEPLAGAELLLRPGGVVVRSRRAIGLQPPRLAARGCLFAMSGVDGRFLLGSTDRPDSVLSVRAPGHAGRDLPFSTDLAEPIVLPVWVGGELSLHVQAPVAGSAWRLQVDVGDGVEIDCRADEDGVVALPCAGAFDFEVTSWVGDELRGERTFSAVAATGPVLLPSPRIE